MLTTDPTIAAVATAHGVGSIAIVRLSGSQALELAKKVSKSSSLKPRHAHLKNLYDKEDTLIDEAIVIYFKAPHSFTGEDIVEFQCHGGILIAQMLLETLFALGAVPAEPGAFSKRAFMNGKIDLTQAEAIATLIEAKSEDAVKMLSRQMKGELKLFIESIRDQLLELIAFSEVSIDYAEEDLPEDLVKQMKTKLETISQTLEKSLRISRQRMVLIEGYKVAIVGKPNVGKSSLLNALLHYERAIVSDIAGTTRDTIEERIKIGTHLIRIVDTAGIRHAKDTIEKIGIKRSKKAIEEADIILALFDASQEASEEDSAILELLQGYTEKKLLVVLNKSDLEKKIDERLFSAYERVDLSCKKEPLVLIEKLEAFMNVNNQSSDQTLTSHRQIQAVEASLNAIKEAVLPLEEGELEFFSFHLNQAIEALSSITRPVAYDEMLDKMFGNFCLGK